MPNEQTQAKAALNAARKRALDEAKKDEEFWGLNEHEQKLARRVAENFYTRVSLYFREVK